MHLMARHYILLFLFLFQTTAFAKDLTFGAEFTFTNDKIKTAGRQAGAIVNIPEAVAAAEAFKAEVLNRCQGCTVRREMNSYGATTYRITYPDGWYFVIATDPSVVEVQTKPSTVDTVRKLQSRMQNDIFDAAKAAGILPDSMAGTGGGHIHFDYLASTEADLLRLRNLVVDFANHPELAQSIWAYDFHNSGPLAALPKQQRQAFVNLIADVDSGKVTTTDEFVTRLRKEVYNHHEHKWSPPDKYQALNLNRVNDPHFKMDQKTIEVRCVRPQKDAQEFLAVIEVLDGRIELNKTRSQPLALRMPEVSYYQRVQSTDLKKHLEYVAEAGIEPKKYAAQYKSLPENWARSFAASTLAITQFCSRIFTH